MVANRQALDWFVTLFNLGYPDWEKQGDASAKLTADDVEYSWTTGYWGKCGPRSGANEVYFARNKEWWRSHGRTERIGLLIHELAHYKHTDGHSPSFYLTMGNCYNRIKTRAKAVEQALGFTPEFENVAEWLVTDIEQHQVDTRKQTVYESRKSFANKIGYNITEQTAIDGIKLRHITPASDNCDLPDDWVVVSLHELVFEPSPMTAVASWLRNPHKDYATMQRHGSAYRIERVPAVETANGYKLQDTDGEKVASLLHHYGKELISLRIE